VDDVIRKAPLFQPSTTRPRTRCAARWPRSTLGRGQVLFREGDSGDKLYVVADGKVKLGRTSSAVARTCGGPRPR